MKPETAYENLLKRSREVSLLGNSSALLSWDQETYLPEKGVAYRAEQQAYLAGLKHRLATAPEIGAWLTDCEQAGYVDSDPERGPNVREWRRDYDRAAKTPPDLVEEMARTASLGQQAWQEARRKSEFKHFAPLLGKIIELTRRQADCWGWKDSRYDALLDYYEPGATSKQTAKLLMDLAQQLKALLPGLQQKFSKTPVDQLKGHYPIAAQEAFNREVAEAFGFDFDAGRIDVSTHPFCSGMGPRDCRLTTRYDEKDFTDSFFSVLHECGHGLYEQGLKEEYFGSPLGESVSLGIHESQSRLWENQIGRSRAFWQHWYPRAQHYFPELKERSLDEFWLAINRVQPSFIRVDADEATYNLHIALRFELEKRLIEGDLKIADLPEAWNERFEQFFGLKVPDDARGCLQDVHWSGGGFGYFPTYTLGNLNAAQLFRSALGQNSGLKQELADGSYQTLRQWLKTNIHEQGRRYLSSDLMQKATGEPTRTSYFIDYLEAKFAF